MLRRSRRHVISWASPAPRVPLKARGPALQVDTDADLRMTEHLGQLDFETRFTRQFVAKIKVEFQLDSVELNLLSTLLWMGPTRQARLVNDASLNKVVISRSIARLIKRNLIERTVAPGEKFVSLVALTLDGNAILSRALEFMASLYRELRAEFERSN